MSFGFEFLVLQVKEANIDSRETLEGVIDQIFKKSLAEPYFCGVYAEFCLRLSEIMPSFDVEGPPEETETKKITFKRVLLNKCQNEFEVGTKEHKEAEGGKEGEEGLTKQQIEANVVAARKKMRGNIKFVGELYKLKMLTERIMHECIKLLLGFAVSVHLHRT